MVQISRILCPVDFSEFSRRALEHAVALARWYGAQVTVFHVYTAPQPLVAVTGTPGDIPLLPPVQPEEVMEEVRRFCAPVMAGAATPEILVEEGDPARRIAAQAERIPADLLIMGTHGRGGFERLFLGSVTEKVLRMARCPVLTVPPPAERAPSGPVLYKTILCPLDFSDASMRALEYALSLAKEAHARVILLHVLLPLLEQVALGNVDKTVRYSLPEYLQSFERDAMKRLKAAVPPDARAWCTPEEKVASGKPYRAIIQVADEAFADLIVMGVHGEGVSGRWLFGSTTHHVIREVACPVLTLRA